MQISLLDQKIVAALEADARLSFAALADVVGISKTPCWKRVKALEEAGVIRGYRTLLDPAMLGFGLEAFVQVSIDFEFSDAFEAAVRKHPLIWRCHATTGDADYLLHVMAADMVALDRMLRQELSLRKAWPLVLFGRRKLPGAPRSRDILQIGHENTGRSNCAWPKEIWLLLRLCNRLYSITEAF